jgi:hypothetical protein
VPGEAGGAIVDAAGTTIEIQDSGQGADTAVAKVDASGSSTLFTVGSAGASITNVCVAPNGLYAAVSTSAQQITYVDLADGSALGTFAGRGPNWCSAR